MSQVDLLLNRASAGSHQRATRSDFRVFLALGKNPGVEVELAEGGHLYYQGLGFGIATTFYNKSGASAWDQSGVNTYVDSQHGKDYFPYVDIWYTDYEGTYYSFSVADAATCITDTNSVIGWANTRFGTYGVTNPTLGIYTPNGAGGATKGPTSIATAYWIWSPAQREVWRADNSACADIQSAWDFICPEIYTYAVDQFAMKAEMFAQEKAAVGGTAKLIPMFQPTLSGVSCTAEQMYAVLEYAYGMPEVSGLILWSYFLDPSAAPVYYDDQDWMVGAQQFMVDYGITKGTPF